MKLKYYIAGFVIVVLVIVAVVMIVLHNKKSGDTPIVPEPVNPEPINQEVNGINFCKQQSLQMFNDENKLKYCSKNGETTCLKEECKCCPENYICDDTGECICSKDTENDNQNCGKCGNTCNPDQTCQGGVCVCNQGKVNCSGECSDLVNDPNNCGGCNNKCSGDKSVCLDGVCQCNPGKIECSGGCKDVNNDPDNCGSCGNICPDNKRLCLGGVCECSPGKVNCSGNCTDVNNDPNNCGTCGLVCSGDRSACQGGQCVCDPNSINKPHSCGDICVNFRNDNNNCGSCNNVCQVNSNCQDGQCVCIQPFVKDQNGNCSCPVNTLYQNGQCVSKNYVWAKSGLYYKGQTNTSYELPGNSNGDWQKPCLVKDQYGNIYSGTYYDYSLDSNNNSIDRGRCIYQDINNQSQVAYDVDDKEFNTFPIIYGLPNTNKLTEMSTVSDQNQRVWSGNVNNTQTYLCRANGTDGSSYFGYIIDNMCNITDKAGVSSDVPNFNYVATINNSYENKNPEECSNNLCTNTAIPQGVIGVGQTCSSGISCPNGTWCQSNKCVEGCKYNSTNRTGGLCDISGVLGSCENKDCSTGLECKKYDSSSGSYINGIDSNNRAIQGSVCVNPL